MLKHQKMIKDDICNRLKNTINNKGVKQNELAKNLDIHPSTFNRWIDVHNPSSINVI